MHVNINFIKFIYIKKIKIVNLNRYFNLATMTAILYRLWYEFIGQYIKKIQINFNIPLMVIKLHYTV